MDDLTNQRKIGEPLMQGYDPKLHRCCVKTLDLSAPRVAQEGLELACHHCDDVMVYVEGRWESLAARKIQP